MNDWLSLLAQLSGGPPEVWEAPIDKSRPAIKNPDGSRSTELQATFGDPGNYVNIPTIVNGQNVGPEAAYQMYQWGVNNPVGRFPTLNQAEIGAILRSQNIGKVRGF